MKKLLVLVCILFLLVGSSVYCIGPKIDKHTATWDANIESDLTGYYLYWKTLTGTFVDANRVVILKSSNPQYDLLLLNLPSGMYVIAVSAYNTAGNESTLSAEVTWNAVLPTIPKNPSIK